MSDVNVGYEFDDVDEGVIAITGHLIVKVLESGLLSPFEREHVFMIAKVFAELPNRHEDIDISLMLTGPRRHFENREIYHYWSIEVEGPEIRVGAGGYFYRPSTGGDSFTSFSWGAYPGCETQCYDYLSSLHMVDDAKPFGTEVEELNLAEPGFTVRVMLDGDEIVSDDDVDEYEDEKQPDEELVLCLWAFLDADIQLVYALSGRAYCLPGDDESKLATLQKLSRYDFRTASKTRVPDRFRTVNSDGEETGGLAHPRLVNDPDAMLFEELLKEIEETLPPIADFVTDSVRPQKIPDDPLSVRTIVYEDAHGNCRAIIDKEDRNWLDEQMQ